MPDYRHPEDKPEWIDKWPTQAEMNSRFPDTLKKVARMQVMRLDYAVLTWTHLELRVSINSQLVVWHFDNPGWSIRCSCKYTSPECVHAYMADLVFRRTCLEEGWTLPMGNAMKNTPASMSASIHSPAGAVGTQLARQPMMTQQKMSFSEARREASQLAFGSRDNAGQNRKASLEIEADFNVSSITVDIRFYLIENGRRTVARLQNVRQWGYQLSMVKFGRQCDYEFSDDDKRIILKVYPILQKRDIILLRGFVIQVPKAEFANWVEIFKGNLEKIVDRSSRKSIKDYCLDMPERLQFEIYDHGRNVSIGAVFVFPDGNRMHFSALRKLVMEDPSGYLVQQSLKKFKCPLDFAFLSKYFSMNSISVSKYEACAKLQVVTDGHLEMIAEGDIVKKVSAPRDRLVANAAMNPNGSVTVTFRSANGNSPAIASSSTASVRFGNGIFIVTVFERNRLDDALEAFNSLSATEDRLKASGSFSFPGSEAGIAKLHEAWQKIPREVARNIEPNLRKLLEPKNEQTSLQLKMREVGPLVDVQATCVYGNSIVNYSDLNRAVRNNSRFMKTSSGEWFEIDPDKFSSIMAKMAENGLDWQSTSMLRSTAGRLVAKLKDDLEDVSYEERSAAFVERLRKEAPLPLPGIPANLLRILRGYQRIGVEYMAERCRYGVGAILADDMGLGKTLQVLALLSAWRGMNRGNVPSLVISPASVCEVWIRQAQQFGTGLKMVALRGSKAQRERILARNDYDVIVTHYGLARMDATLLKARKYSFIILDEAQNIKNPDAQVTKAVRSLQADCRLAITGTPLENSLQDLWSIMDFLNPGLCGDRDDFMNASCDEGGRQLLARRLKLLMLRRPKSLVASELPPKTEETVKIEMPDDMREKYDTELVAARLAAREGGFGQILAALTRLRRFCCAPALVEGGNCHCEAPKIAYLMERIEELTESGHSVLVFSQFTTMLDIIQKELEHSSIPFHKITGETPVERRGAIVAEFDASKDASVFLLSLKAAGTGLTLTKADYVFLMDPWWNPAVENQAIDRTHRIGQDKPVFAYRLIMEDSIEEKVMMKIEEKKQLFAEVIDGVQADGNDSRLSIDELRGLLG